MIIHFSTYAGASTFWVCPFENGKLDLLSRPFKRPPFSRLILVGGRRGQGWFGEFVGKAEGLCVWNVSALDSRGSKDITGTFGER